MIAWVIVWLNVVLVEMLLELVLVEMLLELVQWFEGWRERVP